MSDDVDIELGLLSGTRLFRTADEFMTAVEAAVNLGIQSTKQRTINFLRSAGPNRGFLFPKDTGALIENGVMVVTQETHGGLEFQFTYGFDIFYADYVNKMNFVTKLGLYHYQFFEKKLPAIKKILEEELQERLTIAGFDAQVSI